MNKYRLSQQELIKIIELARLAPSAHNTQPWLVRNNGYELEISLNEARALESGDPVGRQSVIGLGIFTQAVAEAAKSLGLKSNIFFNGKTAQMTFKKTGGASQAEADLLKSRVTDRSVFTKSEIPKTLKEAIGKSSSDKRVQVWLVDDEKFIRKLAELTAKGVSLALSNPQFRNELARYLVRPWSRKARGISVKSLYIPRVAAIVQPELLRFSRTTKKESGLEEKRWLSASAVILITTDGDLDEDWFEAGRTYLRACLSIEKAGLSQATSAATVEAATFHEDVEKMLGTNQRLQAVIRVGKGSERRPHSPRLSAEELIVT